MEGNVYTALLPAGLVLSMACLKHSPAITMSLRIELWRDWVFVVLNVVLLAIFLTSTKSEQDFKTLSATAFSKSKGKKSGRKRAFSELEETRISENAGGNQDAESDVQGSTVLVNSQEVKDAEVVVKEDEDELNRLNERVEAFITMFRQKLVLDATKFRDRDRDREEAEFMNMSAPEITCSV